ncbi:MAG: PKD domain-containing protein, partial [Planctomycetia bacterium]|nr:PKD domain-containing protein [Planctomycetia bacterium]
MLFSGSTALPVGQVATWFGSFTDPGNDTWTMSIDFGDQTTTTVTPNQYKTFLFNHTYTVAGWYTLTATTSDGKDSTRTTWNIAVGNPSVLSVAMNNRSQTPVAPGSVLTLHSNFVYGSQTNPAPGERVVFSLVIRNDSREAVSLDFDRTSLPTNVTWLTKPSATIKAQSSVTASFLWNAYADLAGNVTFALEGSTTADYTFALAGQVAPLTDPPEIDVFELRNDTGENTTDLQTYDSTLRVTASGQFGGGYCVVEFDHNADGEADGQTTLYASDTNGFYDPTTATSGWTHPETGTTSASVNYRLVHYHHDGTLWSTGSWSTFSCTLLPIPASTATVGSFAIIPGYGGGWTLDGAAKLTGQISGASQARIELVLSNGTSQIASTVTSFPYSLPALAPGQTYTATARALAYDDTDQVYHPGPWSTFTFTTNPPAVASLQLRTDDGNSPDDHISSGLTVTGTLDSGIGRTWSEVEISCDNTILGYTWTDAEGTFVYTPRSLTITNGIAAGTLSARAVLRDSSGNVAARGTAASLAVTYSPAAPTDATITLASPDKNNSLLTTEPIIALRGTWPAAANVRLEYQWKTESGSWSSSVLLMPGLADSDEDGTNREITS